ncbi:hypothetical protein TNCV_4334831 [Trichonephila clavipes]|nr:hypothetical protein TNCV_4334831 [Trichonephila clavipes]
MFVPFKKPHNSTDVPCGLHSGTIGTHQISLLSINKGDTLYISTYKSVNGRLDDSIHLDGWSGEISIAAGLRIILEQISERLHAWCGSIVIVSGPSNDSRYCSRMNLVSDCGRITVIERQVWWCYGECNERTYLAERQIDSTLGIMSWDGIIFDHRMSLVHIDGCLAVAPRHKS